MNKIFCYIMVIFIVFVTSPVKGEDITTKDKREKSSETLFEPLIADPRWPHFSVTYQKYANDDELENIGSTSFGETFRLRPVIGFGGKFTIGIQAAVFAFFNLDADSMDLINADYWIGFPIEYRKDKFSSIFRLFHRSSHLGDEYLINNKVDRINLSYESIDMKFSYDINEISRIYSGAGYIFRKEPEDIEPISLQIGTEYKSGKTFFDDIMRPIAGFDIKTWEENDWKVDTSIRCGVQLENISEKERKIQVMLEYFHGNSPHGQFYDRRIEYTGVGIHLYF